MQAKSIETIDSLLEASVEVLGQIKMSRWRKKIVKGERWPKKTLGKLINIAS